MKNIFENIRLDYIKTALKQVSLRFPFAILLLLVIAGLMGYEVATNGNNITTYQIVTSSSITFFLSTSIYLIGESYSLSFLKKNLLQIVAIAFGTGFYFTLSRVGIDSDESFTSIGLSLSGFLSLLFVAPFIKKVLEKTYNQDAYYNYLYKVSITFLISAITGGVLMILGSIAIASVFNLFDISIPYESFFSQGKLFAYWAIFSFSLVSPIFGLVRLPAKDTFDDENTEENGFFTWMIRYIGIPFIYVYFFILYAYTTKVLMNAGDWPKSQITWMVIAFSIFGYKMYAFSYSLEKNTLVRIFRKFFPFVVIPQVLMLFYAIYLRIYQYDITINRYFVVVFGVFLLIISLYYSLSRTKFLAMIPFVLGIIIILISIGPWSVFSLPESRQYDKLIQKLEQAHILQGQTIVPLKSYEDISPELSGEIASGIEYMCSFHECEKIKKLFEKESQAIEKKTREDYFGIVQKDSTYPEDSRYIKASKWQLVSGINEAIKVRSNSEKGHYINPYIVFRLDYKETLFPIETKNYQYIAEIEDFTSPKVNPTSQISVAIDYKNSEIILSGPVNSNMPTLGTREVLEKISIKNLFDTLIKKHNGTYETIVTKQDLTFEISGKKYAVKLFFHDINIPNPEYKEVGNNNIMYQNTSGYALIQKK